MRSMRFRCESVLAMLIGAAICSSAWQQQQQTLPRTAPQQPQGQLRGHVRLPDGRTVTQGFLVILEIRGGGTFGLTQTDPSGKFEFTMMPPDTYIVRVKQPGYREALEEVDLRTTSTAYVSVEVHPLPMETSGATAAAGVVSARSMTIPDSARKDYDVGKDLLATHKDYNKSIASFKKAISAYPNFPEAYLAMGLVYIEQKHWREAREALQRAAELNPKDAGPYIALGGLANLEDKHAEAEQPLLKALQLAPESPDAHFELARAYWEMGRWQDADPHAAKVVRLKPENPDAHVMMGNILLRKRDGAGALKEFQEALRLAPDSPLAPKIRQLVTKIETAMKNPKP